MRTERYEAIVQQMEGAQLFLLSRQSCCLSPARFILFFIPTILRPPALRMKLIMVPEKPLKVATGV